MPHPKPGGTYGLRHQALLPFEAREPLAKLPEKRAPPRSPGLEPELVLGRAPQREAFHELSPVECQSPLQTLHELPASYGGGGAASSSWLRGFSPCQRDCRFERVQVYFDPPRLQSQKVALDDEEARYPVTGCVLPQGLPELVQDGAQVRTGVALLALGPQKLREPPPRVPSALGGQVAQERELLLYPEPDGQPLEARLRRPQQPEA